MMSQPKVSKIEYSGFSFEDFLQDAFFIESVKRPDGESRTFWEEYRQSGPRNLEEYEAARKFIEDVNEKRLTDKEVSEIRNNVKTVNHPVRKIRPAHYIGVAAAASVAVILILVLFAKQQDVHDMGQDIIAFVTENQIPETGATEAQLILSDKKTIRMSGKESTVTYDSVSIKLQTGEVPREESAAFNQLVVPRGKRSMIVLHEGTKIWINAGTRLVYPLEFAKDKREVYVDGEIYLDVACDRQRPFIVRTAGMSIEVLGTKFNVQAYSSDVQKRVALEEGSVKISGAKGNELLLSPDKMYEYNNGKETVTDVDIRKYTSWVNRLYIYESERLEVILARLSRYYGVDIVADAASAKLKCSGKLDLKDVIDDVLNGLSYTAPITYTCTDGKYRIDIKGKPN
jgi:ferric-dicitrate binding protein FerR (iron transport regulator)